MGILQYFFIVFVVGLAVWLIHAFAPIPSQFKTIILWAGIAFCLFILLQAMGVLGHDWMIPRVR